MNAMNRLGSWLLLHPRLVTALVFAGVFAAAFVLMPQVGLAAKRPRP